MSKENTKKTKKDTFFGTIHQSNNEIIEYKFEPPIYGESNTDQSYYEPQSTRIANMRKSASGLSTGVYDFDKDKKINPKTVDITSLHVPFGRSKGITFEEFSQVKTNNAENLKAQSDEIENSEKAKKEAISEQIETSKQIISEVNSGNSEN